jgi:uncharacterized repeat protein (TIGR02543 family)
VTAGGVSVSNNTFIMPANDVTVTANWTQDTILPPVYKVTVKDSYADKSGSGTYTPGTIVTIDAGTKAGYTFKGWTVTSGGVTLTDANSITTSFTMPSNDVTVTANWSEDTSTSDSGKWALVNLILCCIGALAALFALIRVFIQKNKITRWIWLALAVIAGIAGVVVFLITENMSLPMQMVDWWTIVNAIILVIGVIGVLFASKRADDKHQTATERKTS